MNTLSRHIFSTLLVFALLAGVLPAAEPEAPARDALVYKDGDRLHGHLVSSTPELIVFRSERFGQISVAADQVVVIKAEPAAAAAASGPADPAKGAGQPGLSPAEKAEAEKLSRWEYFSPAVLAAKLHNIFGPWHGRLAFSMEVVSDTADRSTFSTEAQLKRKWPSDEVQLNGRFDYSETATLLTSDTVATTDTIKADGLWRHDFDKKGFAQYRPTLEWNRAYFRDGRPADYVLLQQEVGAGVSLSTKPGRKLRVGLSENFFNVWTTSPPTAHEHHTAESVFLETEVKLPWGLLLSDRGVYYYSLSTEKDGWENRVEVTKKFTETLSTAVRHEIRQGNLNGTVQDYTRLRLLVGLDF